jgi:hypothetical protein
MTIDTKQKELVGKLLGMLGSDFDAERAVAAKKISDIAKSHKSSVADLMRLCFASTSSYRQSPPPPPRQDYGHYQHDTSWSHPVLLKEMSRLIDEWGAEPLSAWEANFAADICDRLPDRLSEKQLAVVIRIIEKLKKCATSAF